MPANVESMFYTGAEPWHGLGEKLEEAPTISEAINKSGLDWEVGVKDLVTTDGYDVPAKATYRKSDNSILGVVGPRYVPLQNKDAFEWFQPFVDAGECSLHMGGSLSGGQKVWALAQLNRDPSEIVKGDEVQKFILLSNSHDGTTAIRVGYTPIRVVCVNTLAFAHSHKQSNLLRIRHTKSAQTNLDNVRDIMDNINAQFEATAEQFRFLASRDFNQADVRKYVKVLLNVDKTVDEDLKTVPRMSSMIFSLRFMGLSRIWLEYVVLGGLLITASTSISITRKAVMRTTAWKACGSVRTVQQTTEH